MIAAQPLFPRACSCQARYRYTTSSRHRRARAGRLLRTSCANGSLSANQLIKITGPVTAAHAEDGRTSRHVHTARGHPWKPPAVRNKRAWP